MNNRKLPSVAEELANQMDKDLSDQFSVTESAYRKLAMAKDLLLKAGCRGLAEDLNNIINKGNGNV